MIFVPMNRKPTVLEADPNGSVALCINREGMMTLDYVEWDAPVFTSGLCPADKKAVKEGKVIYLGWFPRNSGCTTAIDGFNTQRDYVRDSKGEQLIPTPVNQEAIVIAEPKRKIRIS